MKTNEELQKDVQESIKWEPLLHAAEIGVTVKDGVVTLTGVVDSYAKKVEAEEATKKVAGVKAVVEKIIIKYGTLGKKSDGEIATDVLGALKWNWQIPSDDIKVKVEDGWITLEGEVTWNHQKGVAKSAVNYLLGVTGVTNNITIKSESKDLVEKKAIERAIARNWAIQDCAVSIAVSGNIVTLSGNVNSWYQKEEVERVAQNAPGVWSVNNELIVEHDFSLSEN